MKSNLQADIWENVLNTTLQLAKTSSNLENIWAWLNHLQGQSSKASLSLTILRWIPFKKKSLMTRDSYLWQIETYIFQPEAKYSWGPSPRIFKVASKQYTENRTRRYNDIKNSCVGDSISTFLNWFMYNSFISELTTHFAFVIGSKQLKAGDWKVKLTIQNKNYFSSKLEHTYKIQIE